LGPLGILNTTDG